MTEAEATWAGALRHAEQLARDHGHIGPPLEWPTPVREAWEGLQQLPLKDRDDLALACALFGSIGTLLGGVLDGVVQVYEEGELGDDDEGGEPSEDRG